MNRRVTPPEDHLIVDHEARAWVEETRRKAADGRLLGEASDREDIVRHLEQERRRFER